MSSEQGGAQSWPVPGDDGVFLDHIGHFVPDMDDAAAALERLGFSLTPYSVHVDTDNSAREPQPSGTANRLIMLDEGYLEILAVHGDAETPVAGQLRKQMARYVGVHLTAFCCRDPEGHRDRLASAGFPMGAPVHLRRETEDEAGNSDIVAFTVIRPRAGAMAEGRIQYLRHERPDLMWQKRWMTQINGAAALIDIMVCNDDIDAASERWRRYFNRPTRPCGEGAAIDFERGQITIQPHAAWGALFSGCVIAPSPGLVGYAMRTKDLAATRQFLEQAGFAPVALGDGAMAVDTPAALGGVLVFAESSQSLPWSGT